MENLVVTIQLINFGSDPTREAILKMIARDLSGNGASAYNADTEHVKVSWEVKPVAWFHE